MFKSSRTPKRGFSLVELLTVVAIIGILAAIAGPMYLNYVRKSRTSEAISTLATIALFEETYFSENDSYVSAGPNPADVPTSSDPGGRLTFDTAITGWNLLGRVMPQGTPLYFQYEVRAGQFDGASSSVTGGTGSLVAHNNAKIPGGTACSPQLTAHSGQTVGVPVLSNSNWYYITAVGNQKAGGLCSLFIKVIDRTDIYKENEIE